MHSMSGRHSIVEADTIAVVVTTYNHAHFLREAIDSALGQTRRPDEIIVVDDGSLDNPSAAVAAYKDVRLIKQSNKGLAAARNTGMLAARSRYIAFLDADDRLLPTALEAGLDCIAAAPDSAFVYGGYRNVDHEWVPSDQAYQPISEHPYRDFLTGNVIGMHATVLYRRDILAAAGGFDETLRRCEDYEVYLRLSHEHPVASHPAIIADYRHHGQNMSLDTAGMLDAALAVLDRHKKTSNNDKLDYSAYRKGRLVWQRYYGGQAAVGMGTELRRRNIRGVLALLPTAVRHAPIELVAGAARAGRRYANRKLTNRKFYGINRMRFLLNRLRGRATIPVGGINFGDFARTEPISDEFGYDRGWPIDRFYIERFLDANKELIKGRALEIGDDAYTRRFGGDRVEIRDVLHVEQGNPAATFVGDLSQPGLLPPDSFDCIILTQTIHLIFDMRAALREVYRALKPGGVALVTTPGITSVDKGEWGSTWYWSLTRHAARRLFDEAFGEGNVELQWDGNVFAATAFLHGVALAEVDLAKLDVRDEAYPVIVSIKATKPHAP